MTLSNVGSLEASPPCNKLNPIERLSKLVGKLTMAHRFYDGALAASGGRGLAKALRGWPVKRVAPWGFSHLQGGTIVKGIYVLTGSLACMTR